MLIYLNALFSDPVERTHALLIGGSVIGGVIVAVGIIKESPKWSVATALVVVGVVIEATCTVALFAFDERISAEQQWQILIATDRATDAGFDAALANNAAGEANERAAKLEKEAAESRLRAASAELALAKLKTPRTLSVERQKAVADATRSFAGQQYTVAISQAADDGEAFWASLYATLQAAGWVYLPAPPPSIGEPPAYIPLTASPGIEIVLDPAKEAELTPAALTLGNALRADGTSVQVNRDRQSKVDEAQRNIILIRIGARVIAP